MAKPSRFRTKRGQERASKLLVRKLLQRQARARARDPSQDLFKELRRQGKLYFGPTTP